MVPCMFVDLDSDEELLESTREQSVAINDNPQNLQRNDTILLGNYWLNEIKSQEDTARQITTICILLLVASFTIITNNGDRIFLMLNDTRPYVAGTHSYEVASDILSNNYLFYLDKIGFLATIICIVFFFLIWVLALNAARKALDLESITGNDELNSRRLADIANIKQIYCNNAVNLIIWGMALFSIFVSGFMVATLKGSVWSYLGSLIMSVSIMGILFLIVNTLWKK